MNVSQARWREIARRLDVISQIRPEASGSAADAVVALEVVLQSRPDPVLTSSLKRLMPIAQRYNTAIELLEALALDTDLRSEVDLERVVLSTIHAAKGLEFHAVFMPGFNEGTLPSARALGSSHGALEERRLAHVAMTRAKTRLVMTARKGSESSYLAEIGTVASASKTAVKRAGRKLKRAF